MQDREEKALGSKGLASPNARDKAEGKRQSGKAMASLQVYRDTGLVCIQGTEVTPASLHI